MKLNGISRVLAASLACVMLISSVGVAPFSTAATIADTADNLGNVESTSAIAMAGTTVYVPDDYPTIQAAVGAASSGVTIVVRAGTYVENIDVNKSDLTIESESGAEVTIVQAASSNDHVFHVYNVNGVRITGLTIKGATADLKGGISLDHANACEITDNVVSQNWVGVGLYMARDNTVRRNTFSNNTYGGGISEDESGSCAVAEAVYAAGIAAEPEETLDSLRILRDNELNPAYVDSYYEYSPDMTRILLSNPELMLRAAQLIAKYMPAVKHVLGQGGEDLEITGEAAQEMVSFLRELRGAAADRRRTMGVARSATLIGLLDEFEDQVTGSEGKMFGEAFRDSVYCAGTTQSTRLTAASGSNNVIYLNNFINNGANAQVQQSANTWNSVQVISYEYKGDIFKGFLGNYWGSSYTGSDAYGDGVGDTAYAIDGNNRDNYPLVDPFANYAPALPELARDDARFVADVTFPDGTQVYPGQELVKTWRLRNAGTTTWTTEYRLVFDGGDLMGAPQYVGLDALVSPGATVDISVPMTAPLTGGARRGYWRMENPASLRFGHTIWVEVFVPHGLVPELAEAIDSVYNISMERLSYLNQEMQTVAQHGDFFRGQIDVAKVGLALTLALGLFGTGLGVRDTLKNISIGELRSGLYIARPSIDISSANGWTYLAYLRNRYDVAKFLFSLGWENFVETAPASLSREVLTGGLKFYAAAFRDEAIETVGEEVALHCYGEEIASRKTPFSQVLYPHFFSLIEMAELELTERRKGLLESLPSLSPEEQLAYAADLNARTQAARWLYLTSTQEVSNLGAIRGFYEQGWTERIVLAVLKIMASGLSNALDGPGKIFVAQFLMWFEAYQQNFKMNESQRMVTLAQSLMARGVDTGIQLQLNAVGAIDGVRDCFPSQPVTGQIKGISHYSVGHTPWWNPRGWVETGSYTVVRVTNNSSKPADFRVVATYLADYEALFGIGTLLTDSAEEVVRDVAPNATVEVRLKYKDVSSGDSPSKDSLMYIWVFGSNPSGIFGVDAESTYWEPQLVPEGTSQGMSGLSAARSGEEIEIMDNPVHVFLSASPEDMTYEVQTWVLNPVGENVTATVVQGLSEDWEVLSAPGASANASQLVWELQLEAGGLAQVSFIFAYQGELSLDIVVPGPTVSLETPEGAPLGELIGDSPSLEPILPVTGSVTVPVEVMPGDPATVSVDLQNLSTETAEGGVIVSVTDPSGSCAYNETQVFSLTASANMTLDYLLPAFSEKGIYQVLTEISHAGVARVMWWDVLRVGTMALEISLNATPLDRVYPGDTITYNISLNNTSVSTLNGVTAEAIIPADMVAHNITGNGQLEESIVKWQLPDQLAPGETAELSFQATVVPDAVGPDEARPIKSSARAISEEAFSASSNEVRILLVGSPPSVMGTIVGNAGLYGHMDSRGLLVTVSGAHITTTASDGSFAVDVPEGSHNVTFTYPGFESAAYEDVMVVAAEEVYLPSVVLIILGDANVDGHVNVLDMVLIGQHWAQTGSPGWIPADVKEDGMINVLDIVTIGQHWTG